MAFKIKVEKFDLDLDLPLMDGSTVIVKCVKKLNGKGYKDYLKFLKKTPFKNEKEAKEFAGDDASLLIDQVVKQIDYLYEKGEDWWFNNVLPETIIAVNRRLTEYHLFREKK